MIKTKKFNNLIVIPTYNEADNIEKLIKDIFSHKSDLDVLIVDDNSPDGTGKIVDRISASNKKVHVIHRKGKLGLGTAYITGFNYGLEHGAQNLLGMDADFSHNPKYLPKIFKAAERYDVVIGSRYVKGGKIKGWAPHRYVISFIANNTARILLGLKFKDVTTGYRCYNREVLESIDFDKIVSSGYAFLVEMVYRASLKNFKFKEIPITFIDRRQGKSKISRSEILSSAKSVIKLASSREGLRQFIKFGFVGVSGTIVDFSILNLLVKVFGVNVYASATVSFTMAVINNYTWNKIWTFKGKAPTATAIQTGAQFLKFGLVNTIGLAVNLAIMYALIEWAHLWYNWAKAIAIVVVWFWNFFGSKYWVFLSRPALESQLKIKK